MPDTPLGEPPDAQVYLMGALKEMPAELTALDQWALWRYEERDGKPTKVPYTTRGTPASSDDPATWTSFAEAVRALEGYDGIMFVFTSEDPYTGIDLDDCVLGGALHPEAERIVQRFASFTEISPSGHGVKIIVRASKNGTSRCRTKETPWEGDIEVYDHARFWTITGNPLPGAPRTIENGQAELDHVLAQYLPARTPPAATKPRPAMPVDVDDQELLERMRRARNGEKFERLWRGDTSGYPSSSEADLALCSLLALATGGDPTRIDRLFRASGLYRTKWDREDYRRLTIDAALEGKTDFNSPSSTEKRAEHTEVTAGAATVTGDAWPEPPAEEAFYGLAGEFVELVKPHTEADPVALLFQLLAMAGNAIGRRPYVRVEADRHHLNEFVCLVGDTAKARKGTARAHAQRAVVASDPDWEKNIASGLSSGEGLIYAVRDRRIALDENGDEKIIDDGVVDKRLLCVEQEFSSVLKVAARDGNTLSALFRQAWDSSVLRTLTRKDPLVATGAHISVIGHITQEELLRYLDATEVANGFANRILFACVRRHQLLPEGGEVPEQPLRELARKLALAFDFARRQDAVERDPEARALWAAEYERLSQARPGLVGALLARAEAHTLRLAFAYAALDSSPQIRVQHLRAALALWAYAERSVLHLFGDSTGNPDADTILRALRANERLTRTQISGLFGRHRTASQIDRALALLLERALTRTETEQTGGRPSEVWYAR